MEVQEQILEKRLRLFVVDASRVARDTGLGKRVNTVLQTCFFALAEVMPREDAIAAIKGAIRTTYGKRGEAVLERNFAAVDRALEGLAEVEIPTVVSATRGRPEPVAAGAPAFVRDVTAAIIATSPKSSGSRMRASTIVEQTCTTTLRARAAMEIAPPRREWRCRSSRGAASSK